MRLSALLARALCASLLASAPAAGAAREPPQGVANTVEELCALLAELEDESATVRQCAHERLLALDLDLLEPLLDVLFYRVVPSAEKPVLSAPAEELLLARLASWPSERVAAACLRRGKQGTLADKLRALELFGTFAHASDWEALLELCGSLSEEDLAHPLASEHVQHATASLLERDASSLRVIARSIDGAQGWLQRALADALGGHGREACLPLLVALLDRNAELDAYVLKAMGSWKRWDSGYGACVELIGRYLRAPEPEVRRTAACTLGRLKAGRALPSLILALDDRHAAVRRGALWSLRYTTGLEFLTGYEEWSAWFEREEAWRIERAPALLEQAAHARVSEALHAVVELGAHPWFEDLAVELAETLEHADPLVVPAVCGALAAFGTGPAFDALLELCEEERPGVRAAARTAFEALAGMPFEQAKATNG